MFPFGRGLGVLLIGWASTPTVAGPPSIPNDPHFASQWALQNVGQEVNGKTGKPGADIQALSAWDIYSGSAAVIVAIVGTGVDPHAEFADRLLEGYVAPSAGGDPFSTLDSAWVGTHVAGIIGSATGNGIGIAGVNGNVRLLPVRVLQGNVGTETSVAEGIEWAVDQGADVIVVPHQFYVGTQRLADAVVYAAARDVVVVAPTGHTASNQVAYPAAFEGCIAVSSTTSNDERADFSNYGLSVDLSAPSQDIWSTQPGGGFGFERQTGSASAAAYVAGAASLVRSYAPRLPAEEVTQILVDSAEDLGESGWDPYFGAGRLDAQKALELTPKPALRFESIDPIPTTIPPDTTTSFTIRIADAAQTVVPTSAALVYRTSASGFAKPKPMRPLGNGLFAVEFPAEPCDTNLEFYLTAAGGGGALVTEPWDAPAGLHSVRVIRYEPVFDDDFEADWGWEVVTEGGNATKGEWTRVIPVGTLAQPSYDRSPDYGSRCFVTGQHFGGAPGNNDVDGGPVRLISPLLPLPTPDAEVSYWRWFYSSSRTPDVLTVEMSRNGGASWVVVEAVQASEGWTTYSFRLSDFPGAVGNQLRIRFTTSDSPNDSLTEAAIDEFRVRALDCRAIRGDADGDGDFDLDDYRHVGDCWQGPITTAGSTPCSVFDFDTDGDVDLRDFWGLQNQFRP